MEEMEEMDVMEAHNNKQDRDESMIRVHFLSYIPKHTSEIISCPERQHPNVTLSIWRKRRRWRGT